MTYPIFLKRVPKKQMKNGLAIKAMSFVSLIIALIGLIAVFLHSDYISSYLIIISSLIFYCFFRAGLIKKNLAIIISSLFYLIEVPIQLLFSIFSPDSIIGSNYNKFYDKWIFYDNSVVLKYFTAATAFLVISAICGFGIGSFSKKTKTSETISSNLFLCPLAGGIVVFALQVLTNRYGITNGYIAYFLEGLQLYFLMALVANLFSKEIKFNTFILLIIGIIIYSAYGIIIGRRVFVVRGTLDVLLFLILLKPYYIKRFIKKHFLILIVFVVGFFALYGFANYLKFGVFDPVGSFVKRIIGLFDGSVVLSYQSENNTNLGFLNYFKCVIDDSGIRANKFYTYSIMLFPADKPNGYASPIFAASMLYGLTGMIVISFFFSIMMAIICKSLSSRIVKDRESLRPLSLARSFILCDAIVLMLQKYYLDGNIEILKDFIVSIIAFIFVCFKTIYSNNFNKEGTANAKM